MNIKHVIVIFGLTLPVLFPCFVHAQDADQLIGDLINQRDWFRLEEEYPKVADSLQSVAVKGLSEVMIGIYFNKPEETIYLIDSLVAYHQDDLGFPNVSSLVILRSKLLGETGRYARSADDLYRFLNQIESFANRKDFPFHQQLADYYNVLRNEAAPSITRPGKDTEVPMTIEKAGRGVLMFIPVQIHGKEYKFIFDTGAGSTFLSKRFAEDMGVRIVRDSLFIQGAIGTDMGKGGILDSLTIGDITFKNTFVTIANPNPAVDTVYQVDAVLGTDFMRLVGEVNIYPKEGRIVFPVNKSPLPAYGRNLWFYDGGIRLKAFSGDECLRFILDTGDVRASLFSTYYDKHKQFVEQTGIKDTISSGGFGGVRRYEVFRLKSFPLRVGDASFEIPNMPVEVSAVSLQTREGESGSLGMDFIQQFDRIIINLDNTYLSVE